MEDKSIKDQFLKLYHLLEATLKNRYETKKISYIDYEKQGLLKYQDSIEMYKSLRNILSHNDSEDRIIITQKLIDEMQDTISEITTSVNTLKISRNKILAPTNEDNVLNVMKEMNQNDYTNIPIVEGNTVIGFFGEKTLFHIISEGLKIDKDTTFSDIRSYTAIEDNTPKVAYAFITAKTTRSQAVQIINDAEKRDQRIDVLFITNDGTAQGKLLGLITPWDLFVVK